jgi:hypothetical protein
MKSRSGFVSNSSTSSFIVRYQNFDVFQKDCPFVKRLNKRIVDRLKKYGFKSTWIRHPSRLDELHDTDDAWKLHIEPKSKKPYEENLGLWVVCNENEVMRFLIRAQVDFVASCHYGHETYVYHKGDRYVMRFRNLGNEVETYHQGDKFEKIVKKWHEYDDIGFPFKPYEKMPLTRIMEQKDAKKVYEKISKQKEADKEKRRKQKEARKKAKTKV